jgi:hypothetical protein
MKLLWWCASGKCFFFLLLKKKNLKNSLIMQHFYSIWKHLWWRIYLTT